MRMRKISFVLLQLNTLYFLRLKKKSKTETMHILLYYFVETLYQIYIIIFWFRYFTLINIYLYLYIYIYLYPRRSMKCFFNSL